MTKKNEKEEEIKELEDIAYSYLNKTFEEIGVKGKILDSVRGSDQTNKDGYDAQIYMGMPLYKIIDKGTKTLEGYRLNVNINPNSIKNQDKLTDGITVVRNGKYEINRKIERLVTDVIGGSVNQFPPPVEVTVSVYKRPENKKGKSGLNRKPFSGCQKKS